MRVLIALPMYDANDVCVELAKRTGKREPYSRSRVDILIKEKLPTAQKIGNRYFVTEKEVDWLATKMQLRKRPKIY